MVNRTRYFIRTNVFVTSSTPYIVVILLVALLSIVWASFPLVHRCPVYDIIA